MTGARVNRRKLRQWRHFFRWGLRGRMISLSTLIWLWHSLLNDVRSRWRGSVILSHKPPLFTGWWLTPHYTTFSQALLQVLHFYHNAVIAELTQLPLLSLCGQLGGRGAGLSFQMLEVFDVTSLISVTQLFVLTSLSVFTQFIG